MKQSFFVAFFILLTNLLFAKNNTSIIRYGKATILLNNNFILHQKNKKTCNKDSSIQSVSYYVYGDELNVSIYEHSPYNISFSNLDTFFSQPFNFNQIKFQVLKNEQALTTWKYINTAKRITDSTTKYNNVFQLCAYQLYANKLADSDKIVIRIKFSSTKYLSIELQKCHEDNIPFCFQNIRTDNEISLENFLEKNINRRMPNTNFYDDWPSSYIQNYYTQNEKVSTTSKIINFYRIKKNSNGNGMLEYRLLVNDKPLTNIWNEADNYIILHNFKSGCKYILQVRYKGSNKYIEQKYYTEQEWYQTIWAKIVVLIMLLSVSTILYLFFKNQRNKQNISQQKAQLQSLSIQLNPHFIFNSLNSIQGLINNGNIDKTNYYLNDFAKLLRNVIDFSKKEKVTLQQDIEALQKYISLEQLRFQFHFAFNITPSIQSTEIEVLPLLVQPIIENAIKHGIAILQEKGNIELNIVQDKKDLVYTIIDNGKGFNTNQNYTGIGLQLTKEKIELFNNTSKFVKLALNFTSTDKGTNIKIIYKNLLDDRSYFDR